MKCSLHSIRSNIGYGGKRRARKSGRAPKEDVVLSFSCGDRLRCKKKHCLYMLSILCVCVCMYFHCLQGIHGMWVRDKEWVKGQRVRVYTVYLRERATSVSAYSPRATRLVLTWCDRRHRPPHRHRRRRRRLYHRRLEGPDPRATRHARLRGGGSSGPVWTCVCVCVSVCACESECAGRTWQSWRVRP